MEVTERKIIEKQGGIRKERCSVDQKLTMIMMVDEYLRKDEKLYAAFMSLLKAYDRACHESHCNKSSAC